jgi:hypothetical protein
MFSRSALSKLQAVILIVIIIAAVAAVVYIYESRYYSPNPTNPSSSPTFTPSFSPSPTLAVPTALPASLIVSNLFLNPLEAWPGQPVNVSVDVKNTGTENISYMLPFEINGVVVQSVQVLLVGGASETVTGVLNESSVGTYQVSVAGQSGRLSVVPEGEHTLHVIASESGIPFSLDGVTQTSPFAGLVNVGSHAIVLPSNAKILKGGWGLVNYAFQSWNDGSSSTSKTVDVESEIYVTANYVRTTTSCPLLYAWNGTTYNTVADVNDGTGWLGYLEYFKPDGSMIFSYNYPYDYIKLDSTQLQPLNGFYNLKIAEESDEIFYLDSVKLIAVDHPAGTDVFSTKSTFVYNLANQGTIYAVNKNLSQPVSAVNGQGQNVLPLISKMDNNFTTANRWTWNNLTLNLGNLDGAKEINLVVAARINWPTTSAGGVNFMSYANKPGVMPSPPPYMEVKAANGSWVRVPDDREFPIPATSDQVFNVNLTGLFTNNNFELRINYYQDIEFDSIGVDTSSQQSITVHTVTASNADLQQVFNADSNSSGAFTRYGDVTTLLQSTDDKLVIGREGDTVSLQFPANLPPVPPGMVRDYFVVASCWFKGLGLPYVPFTVDPLPFQAMTSFPYPSNETYPYDNNHLSYLQTYNTRIINSP